MSVFRQTEEWLEARRARFKALGVKQATRTSSKPRKARGGAQKREIGVSEHHEQVALIAWWDVWGPANGYDWRLLFSSQNGAHLAGSDKRRGFQVYRLKRAGMRVAVPDLMLAVARGYDYAGLFIEMKRRKGKATRDQLAYHALLRSQGYRVEVCQGFEAARDAILRYLV